MTSVGEIVRGATTRFIPGALVGYVGVALVVAPPADLASEWQPFFGRGLMTSGLSTLGYLLAMLLMRRRLRSDAKVVGRKSAMSGAAALAGLLLLGSVFGGLRAMAGIAIGSGIVTTLLLFFPWLVGTPEQQEADEPRDER